MTTITHAEGSSVAAALMTMWRELLPRQEAQITGETNFFDAGGHSLTAMLLVTRISRDIGKNIPLFALVENPTISSLAKYIANNDGVALQDEEMAPDGSSTQAERLLGYNQPDRRTRRHQAFETYYARAMESAAHAEFCRRVYGQNFGQHGMADEHQLNALLDVVRPGPGDVVLDIGCGYGLISKYISDKTGARVAGIDLAPSAVEYASRLATGNDKLSFALMDIADIDFPCSTFSHIVSIDTIYYAPSLEELVARLINLGKPGARIAVLRTFPVRSFTPETWSPHRTELAKVLTKLCGGYEVVDFSREENAHWKRKVDVLQALKPQFIAEGNEELYEFRFTEASYEAGIEQYRYLFTAITRRQ